VQAVLDKSQPKRRTLMLWYVVFGVVLIVSLGWLGLQVQPASFSEFQSTSTKLESVPLPTGLPMPVMRFYRKVYGAAIWMDDGKPWAVFRLESVVYNADVNEYVQAKGL
jgi:hypothetical protein